MQRSHAVFKLRDQVLLIAALIRLEDHFGWRHRAVVRDVEEIANLVEERELAPLNSDVLAERDDAVGPLALAGFVVEFDEFFGVESKVFVGTFLNDTLLHVVWTASGLGLDLTLSFSDEILVKELRLPFCAFLHPTVRIHSEDEANAIIIPSVEIGGQVEGNRSPHPALS